MSEFKEYVPDWYEVQFSEKDDFRNEGKSEADLAKYGTYWAVKFVGDAGTFYWSKREQPLEGGKYWGHIEPSKSGKSMNFKLEKDQPDTTPKSAASNVETVDKQDSINRAVALNNSVLLHQNMEQPEVKSVTDIADLFLNWLRDIPQIAQKAVEEAASAAPGYEKAKDTARNLKGPHTGDYPVNQTDDDFLDLVNRGNNDS